MPRLEGIQVVVDAESPLARRGWIGILALAGTVTACVPRPELRAPVVAALATLEWDDVTSPEIVTARLPPTRGRLGPAALFHPPAGFRVDDARTVEEAPVDEVRSLFEEMPADELDESGLLEAKGTLFVSRSSTGAVAAACAYRRWPNDVAHLGVVTHPAHRRQGHGRLVATGALHRAIEEGLLPQWRARPLASQALARSLGLEQMGAQLSLEPA